MTGDDQQPEIAATVTAECGFAPVSWHNVSDFAFYFDDEVDDEAPTNTDDWAFIATPVTASVCFR